ncbi:hypothetical protein H310_03965 [Aphanomyces invadans]|uniref:Uncharacterized protein n=1 Tax=Aphanomyces invadans TaxID=157072 RepID=A0A024UG42_9STRA|nr:hypothetical protein H310_03965 [Aphanomyces invadans]ETW04842.1 hypothetical protein H310_03965 [Aphanomyces invadans]|eukprot:XP_008866280.1 hypothetical protein H310_03965 [Aphanomyces invadans]
MIREAAMVALTRILADADHDSSDTDGSSTTSVKRAKKASVDGTANAILAISSFLESANECKFQEITLQREANAIAAGKLDLEEKRYL